MKEILISVADWVVDTVDSHLFLKVCFWMVVTIVICATAFALIGLIAWSFEAGRTLLAILFMAILFLAVAFGMTVFIHQQDGD